MSSHPRLTLEPNRSRILRLVFRLFIAIAIFALVVAGGGYLWFRSAATAAIPQLDGTVALSGLKAPVSVVRDAQGVPHISAASMGDLMFAQGYVTAQDRLWQMDMARRFAAGELAAALGSDYVAQDKIQRLFGFRQVAQRAASELPAEQRAYFEAYARGVNAYIEEHQHSLPLEFRVLRYFPRVWTVEDSFLVGAMMAQMLTHGDFQRELDRERIQAKLGPELTADLYPANSYRDITPVEAGSPGELPPPLPAELETRSAKPQLTEPNVSMLASLLQSKPSFEVDERLSPGSNNWVVSGAHTVTGKPMLSNDMHLQHHMPNVWYETHLTSGDFDVAGVALPGLPAVIVGHNRRIAWGFTSLMPDVQDTYIEQFNDKGEYLTPSGWQRPEIRHETIIVKRGRDVSMDVTVTRHGPIITPMLKGETRAVALRWTIYDPHALSFPFLSVARANNWQEFRQAFSSFGIPGQNVVYADIEGHIGYQATGFYPIRNGNGLMPVMGADDDSHEWTGYVPFDQLPSTFDPPAGIIATANSRVTPDTANYVISNDWAGAYRTERIYRVLRADKKFTTHDMLALQTDVYSDLDSYVAQRLVYATDRAPQASARARAAAEILRQFDGVMDKNSAAAAIVRVARQKLRKRLLESKLGADAKVYSAWMDSVWFENTMQLQPSRWLPNGFADWSAFLVWAVEDTVSDERAPKDLSKWKYGDLFSVQSSHPVFASMPLLKRSAGPGTLPQSGNGQTVKQVGRDFGPSERFTADLSNFDNSTLNIVNGQSGHMFSQHFNDQWGAWYEGSTFTLPFSPQAVQQSAKHTLTLEPAR